MLGGNDASFPLTPTLSLEEREHRFRVERRIRGGAREQVGRTVKAFPIAIPPSPMERNNHETTHH